MFFVILFVIETFCKKYTTSQTSFLQATNGFRQQPERAASDPFQNKSAKKINPLKFAYMVILLYLCSRVRQKSPPMVQKYYGCPQIEQIAQKFLATIYIIIYNI